MCKVLDEVAFYTDLTTIILAYSRSINMGPLLNHFIDPGFHVCPFFSIRKVSPCCSFWDTHTTHGFRVCNGLILGWQPTEEEAEEEKEEEAGEEPEGESKAVPWVIECDFADYTTIHLQWNDKLSTRIFVPDLEFSPEDMDLDKRVADCRWAVHEDKFFFLANGVLYVFWMDVLLQYRGEQYAIPIVRAAWRQRITRGSPNRKYEMAFDKHHLVLCKSLMSYDVPLRKQVQIWG
jgi:hypothetical protein